MALLGVEMDEFGHFIALVVEVEGHCLDLLADDQVRFA